MRGITVDMMMESPMKETLSIKTTRINDRWHARLYKKEKIVDEMKPKQQDIYNDESIITDEPDEDDIPI